MQSHVHLFVLHNRLQKQECRCSSAQILLCASVCLHVHVRARLCFFAHSCYFYLINHVWDKIEFTCSSYTRILCLLYIHRNKARYIRYGNPWKNLRPIPLIYIMNDRNERKNDKAIRDQYRGQWWYYLMNWEHVSLLYSWHFLIWSLQFFILIFIRSIYSKI